MNSPQKTDREIAEEAFRCGLSPNEACKQFPKLSRGNVYRWYGQYSKQIGGQTSGQSGQTSGQSGQSGQSSGEVDDRNNVVRLVSESSDPAAELRWVRKVLRSHISSPDKTTPLVVPAAQAYLRSIQIEAQLPKDKGEEDLSDDERAARIATLFNAARDRRDRSNSSSGA